VLTAQALALDGSAEIMPNPRRPITGNTDNSLQGNMSAQSSGSFKRAVPRDDPPSIQPRLIVRHAVSTPLRPWHDHRRFSRSARNLASR